MSYRGFYKRQRAILEHLDAGAIGLPDLAVHDLICMKANWAVGGDALLPPGISMVSAKAIHALGRPGFSERTVRRSLDRLERLRLIKRWKTPGKHGNYPILVEGFCVRDVSGNEYVVNAKETTDWRQPKLEPVRDLSIPVRMLTASSPLTKN